MASIIELIQINNRDRRFRNRETRYINKALEARSLPLFNPEDEIQIPSDISHDFSMEIGSMESKRLKNFAAQVIENPDWIPPMKQNDYSSISDTLYQKIEESRISHIVSMPSCAGYYFPNLLDSVTFSPYPILGSSIAFHNELTKLAFKFNLSQIELNYWFSTKRQKSNLFQKIMRQEFGKDKWLILSLYAMATASIKYKSLIAFRQ